MNKIYEEKRKTRIENKIKKNVEDYDRKISEVQDKINLVLAQRFIEEFMQEYNLFEGDEWKNA